MVNRFINQLNKTNVYNYIVGLKAYRYVLYFALTALKMSGNIILLEWGHYNRWGYESIARMVNNINTTIFMYKRFILFFLTSWKKLRLHGVKITTVYYCV